MRNQVSVFLLHVLVVSHIKAQDNILKNPDFEEPIGADDWFCNGACILDRSTDAHQGSYSGRVTERTENWHAVSQWVDLETNSAYYFSVWVKLLDQLPGYMWHAVQLLVAIDYVDDPEREFLWFGSLPYLKQHQGWQQAGADFMTGDKALSAVRLYVQLEDAGVDYLIDTASLVKLLPNPDWKVEAEQRIAQIRQEDITVNVFVSDSLDPSLVTIQINQTNHHFPFGSAVRENQLIGTDEDSLKYQDCYYDNFEWAVLENDLKWRQMDPLREDIRYPDVGVDRLWLNGWLSDASLNLSILQCTHGTCPRVHACLHIPQRGHTVFWDVPSSNPDWLQPLTGEEILSEMVRRLDYLIERYQGKLIHWDVNNEQLHGTFYENKMSDPNITSWMFREIRQRDPNVQLFLNDYQVLNFGPYTQALVNSVAEFTAQGAEVQGLGLQSHLRGLQDLEQIILLQKRLDVLSSAERPLWITELDISQLDNPSQLADSYEDVLTLYYSRPEIEGIMLWGFSDQYHSKPDAALFEGPDYEPNESGLRWQMLMNNRWSTNARFTPASSDDSFGLRGFQGNYTLNVFYSGVAQGGQTFYVTPGESTTVNVEV